VGRRWSGLTSVGTHAGGLTGADLPGTGESRLTPEIAGFVGSGLLAGIFFHRKRLGHLDANAPLHSAFVDIAHLCLSPSAGSRRDGHCEAITNSLLGFSIATAQRPSNPVCYLSGYSPVGVLRQAHRDPYDGEARSGNLVLSRNLVRSASGHVNRLVVSSTRAIQLTY